MNHKPFITLTVDYRKD